VVFEALIVDMFCFIAWQGESPSAKYCQKIAFTSGSINKRFSATVLAQLCLWKGFILMIVLSEGFLFKYSSFFS